MKQSDNEVLTFFASFLSEHAPDAALASWYKLKSEVERFLESCNSDTDYPDKRQLRLTLEKALRQTQILLMFPQLVGCHITCHLGLSTPQRKRTLGLHHQFSAFIEQNETVPVIYSGGSPLLRTGLFNHFGYVDNSKNVVDAFQQVKAHLAPSAIFSCVAFETHSFANGKIVIDIPRNVRADNLFFKAFLEIANEVVIHKTVPIARVGLDYLSEISSKAMICQLPAPGADKLERYHLRIGKFQPERSAQPKAQFAFDLEIKSAIQKVLAWAYQEVKSYDTQLEHIRNDLVQSSEGTALSSRVDSIRKDTNESISRLRDTQKLMSEGKDSLLLKANKVYSELESIYFRNHGVSNHISADLLQRNNWAIAEDYFLDLFYTGSLKELIPLAEQMDRASFPYMPVLNAYIAELKSEPMDVSFFSSLDKEDKVLLHRAAIHFTSLDSDQSLTIARKHALKIMSKTAKELYFLGLATNRESDFRRALQEGEALAGSRLYELVKQQASGDYTKTLKFLARNLVAEANFEIGSSGNSNYEKTQLRIAGALKHTPALRELASVEENDVALILYQHLEEEGLLDSRSSYLFGRVLHQEKHFHKAAKVLAKSAEAEAIALLARMYQYGDGVSQDFSKAKNLYMASLETKPHPKTKANLEKVKAILEEHNSRSSSTDYSKRERVVSSSTEKSSWCFLTTATCKVKGYGDDCEVLTVFRKYRDEVLSNEEGGQALISEYYAIAPVIVECIEQSEDSIQAYNLMWDDYLAPCYRYLLNNQYSLAQATYINLVQMLIRKYSLYTKVR